MFKLLRVLITCTHNDKTFSFYFVHRYHTPERAYYVFARIGASEVLIGVVRREEMMEQRKDFLLLD